MTLGKRSGVAEHTISRIEHGAPLRPTTARKLADALDVSVADLMESPPVPLAEAPSGKPSPEPTGASEKPFDIAMGAAREQARLDDQALTRVWESGEPQTSMVSAANEGFRRLRECDRNKLAEDLMDMAIQCVRHEQNIAALKTRLAELQNRVQSLEQTGAERD